MKKNKLTLENYFFQHEAQTRWKDLDAFQHINNAVFLSYFEDARVVLLKRWNLSPSGQSIIVASVNVNYYKQLLHPSKFIIGQKVSRVGKTSFDIQSTMFTESSQIVSDALITSVCFDFNKQEKQLVYNQIKDDYLK
tara:strand:+ start:181 stop:591 length:411 start_codon:yes stop_codon:yes gene_type:complete